MNMAKHFIIFSLIVCLFSCSSNIKKDEMDEKDKLAVIQQTSRQFTFPLSFDEQDELVRQFAEICCIPEVNNLLLLPGRPSYLCHSLSYNTDENEYDTLRTILSNYGNWQFEEIINQLCIENYLNLNVYIPQNTDNLYSLVATHPIHIVNALYHDALQPIINGTLENHTYEYKISYIIQNGVISEPDMWIDEEFCENNIVYFVSFRDEIVNWNHFAKGIQSISDRLITRSVTYQGFGCMASDDLFSYNGFTDGAIVLPILYGKKFMIRPCDDKYNKFCRFGKPETLVPNLELFTNIDFDPYKTAWVAINEDDTTQYIPITSNPNQFDLEGNDFYVNDTILELDNGVRLYIPPHISTFDSDRNAQCIKIIIL